MCSAAWLIVPSTAVGCVGTWVAGLSSLSVLSPLMWRRRRSWSGSAVRSVGVGGASGFVVVAGVVVAAAVAAAAASVRAAVLLLSTTGRLLVGLCGGVGECGRGLFCGCVGLFW